MSSIPQRSEAAGPAKDITPNVNRIEWGGPAAHPLDVLMADGATPAATIGYSLANTYQAMTRVLLAALHRALRERDDERRRRYALLDEIRWQRQEKPQVSTSRHLPDRVTGKDGKSKARDVTRAGPPA